MTVPNVLGFNVVPLRFSESDETHHDLFIKEHSTRNESADKPSGRTLFVLNVPPYARKENIQIIFSIAGKVKNVIFTEKPTSQDSSECSDSKFFSDLQISGFKVAYVIFQKPEGLLKALELKSLPPLSTGQKSVVCGLQKWIGDYNSHVINPTELQADIDSFMKKYDKLVAERAKEEKKSGQADDEGWITVTRQARRPGLARTQAIENKITKKYKKKKKELLNFYTFQIRESKKQHLAELRQKFEEDKKKITLLKQSRRFKPF